MSANKVWGIIGILLILLASSSYAQSSQNIQLFAVNQYQRANPCQTTQFGFDVRNTGSFIESYDLGIEGMEQYSMLSTNFIILGPGEAQRIDLFVSPECGLYGTEEITFKVLARTSQTLAEADVVLDIARNYDYNVIIAPQVNICNLKQTAIPISIKNNVPFVNQYDISIRGPNFLKQEAKRVELGANQFGITQLVAQPSNPGLYVVDIRTESVRGGIIKTGTQNITVEKCYSSDVNIENPSDIIVSGHSASYKVTVKNEGTKIDTYNFELNSPEWVSFSGNKTTLKPGESKVFTLNAVPLNDTGNYEAMLSVISSETGFAIQDVIKFNVVSLEDAYDLKMSPSHTRILYGQDVINVNLENKGLLPATYDLTLNAPKWAKLTSNSIELQPGQSGVAYIQTTTAEEDEQASYEANVVASVRGENMGFSSSFIVKLRQLTLTQDLYLFTMKYLVFIIIGVVIFAFVIFFAIFGRRIKRSIRNWKLKRREIAKVKAELKATLKARKKEEKLARKLAKKALKESKPKSGKKWFGIVMIIVALLLLSVVAISMAGYVPIVTEFFKQQNKDDKFESMIKVDTTNLEAYGNAVVVRGKETNIPIIVRNNYDETLLFDVEVGQSWIKTDTKEIELEAGEEETINLLVSPKEDTKGIYKISVSASLEKDNKRLTEDLTINVRQGRLIDDVLSYIWYVVGGIVVLIVGLFVKRKSKKNVVKKEGGFAFSKLKYKPIKKVNVELSNKK